MSCPPSSLPAVYIVSAVRTPHGSFMGSLSSLSATDLGAHAIKAAVERSGVPAKEVDEVFLGNVLSAGLGQNPAKQAALKAGLDESIVCTTVNKVCASSLKAVTLAAQAIMTGAASVAVAAGAESMSNSVHYIPGLRAGLKPGVHNPAGAVLDSILQDGFLDPFHNKHVGVLAERWAARLALSRPAQDAFAVRSYKKALAAQQAGLFDSEIVPIEITVPSSKGQGNSTILINSDEPLKSFDEPRIGSLKPAFEPDHGAGGDGTITAANASPPADGAAALVLVSEAKVHQLGLRPLAKIVGWADASNPPADLATAPAAAIPKALARAGLGGAGAGAGAGNNSANSGKDGNHDPFPAVDAFEINEPFGLVAMATAKVLGLDERKVNVNGGSVALGHPLGASGARIVATLVGVLEQRRGKVGVAAICNGGGGATALEIEALN